MSPSRFRAPLLRAWGAPLWAHALGLLLVLASLIPIIDPGASYSADEGAAIVQARSLSDGRGWVIPHPLPEADPTGAWFPLDNSEWGERGAAAYAKHPTYPLMLAAADRLGGVPAMVLLSTLGTVLAAAGAAVLSTRLRRGMQRQVLWSVGLISPLFFDSFWVIAHSLAAACAAWGVVATVVAVERRRPAWGVVGALIFGLAVLLRTESLLLAAGVVLAALVHAVRRRDPMWALIAAAAAGAAAAATWLDRLGLRLAVGDPITSPQHEASLATDSRLEDLLAGFVRTWVIPGPRHAVAGTALVVLGCSLGAIAAWEAGRKDPDHELARKAALAAAGVLLVRGLLVSPEAVPGLLPAFPLAWIGLIVGRRERVHGPMVGFLVTLCAVGIGGVIATQYSVGGDTEWGGRYFAVFLPVVVPFSIAGLSSAGERLTPSARQSALRALVVGSLAMSALAVRELRTSHAETKRFYRHVASAAGTLPAPVIVTTVGYGARLAWRTFDEQQWLYVHPEIHRDVGRRLASAGIERFLLVSTNVEADLEALGDLRIDESTVVPTGGLAVVVYDPQGSDPDGGAAAR